MTRIVKQRLFSMILLVILAISTPLTVLASGEPNLSSDTDSTQNASMTSPSFEASGRIMPLGLSQFSPRSGTEKAIWVNLWDDAGNYSQIKFSLEDMAKECGNGTTWDRVPWNSFYSYFRDRYQGTLCSDDVAFCVRPHGIALYEVDSKTQIFRPGMQVYIYPKSDLHEITITPDGDDIFINFYNGVNLETIDKENEKKVYALKGGTKWDTRIEEYTWGELIDDFLQFYELNKAVERGDWYFKSGTILGAKIDMEKEIDRDPSNPSKPTIRIGPGQVDTERPNFIIKSYIRYYNGEPVADEVFALEGGGGVWSTPVAHYEVKEGHDEGLDEYKRVDTPVSNAGEYTMRRAIINNSGHHFNAGMMITILPIPVIVEAHDKSKIKGGAEPTLTASIRLDEDRLRESFPEAEKYDPVLIETMKALIESELGDNFFTLQRVSGEDIGVYAISASGKEGINPQGNFDIIYQPGNLTITDTDNPLFPSFEDEIDRYYNGTTSTVEAKGLVHQLDTDQIYYQVDGGAVTAVPPTFRDVGTHEVTVLLNREGYSQRTIGRATVAIKPLPVLVTAHDKSKNEGETDPPFTETVTLDPDNLASADLSPSQREEMLRELSSQPYYTLDRADKSEKAGRYQITVYLNNQNNHFAVVKRDGWLTIVPDGLPKFSQYIEEYYDGTSYSVDASGLQGLKPSDRIVYETEGVRAETPQMFKEPGTYVVNVILIRGGQEYPLGSGTVWIKPVPVLITAHDKRKLKGTADPVLTETIQVDPDNVTKFDQGTKDKLLAEVRGLYSGLQREPGEEIGDYTIYVRTDTSPRFQIDTKNGVLTIYSASTPSTRPPYVPESSRPGGGGGDTDRRDSDPPRTMDDSQTIRDENPPLASLPEESSTITIADPPVPLGDSPHTGTTFPIKYALLLLALSGGCSYLLRGRKK